MNLYEESYLQKNRDKNEKNKKTIKVVLIMIIILLVLSIILTAVIIYLKETSLSVSIDGQIKSGVEDIVLIDQKTSQIYIPIKDIASHLGYQAYNGDYSNLSENLNQCYVQNENEVAVFTLNSNKIYKMVPEVSTDYEYYEIEQPVFAQNGKLYTTVEGIEKAFNVSFSYNSNKIQIYTMPYLITSYSNHIQKFGYSEVSENFNNQKAILQGMLIAKTSSQNGKYGVLNVNTGKSVLEGKYDNIEYLEHTSDFLVTSNGKIGIISKTSETKVQLIYDDIEVIDYKSNLYKVSKDNKFGIIDISGNIILHLDYDEIGMEVSQFRNNNIKNKHIILDKLIPIRQGDLWGLIDLKGNQITEIKYDQFGYVDTKGDIVNNLLVIPDYNIIVIKKDDKYSLLSIQGEEIVAFVLDKVYVETIGGETKYYMTWNNKTHDATEVLENLGYSIEEENNSANNVNQNNSNVQNDTENSNDENNQNESENSNDENIQNDSENGNDENNQSGSENSDDENNQSDSENENEENS